MMAGVAIRTTRSKRVIPSDRMRRGGPLVVSDLRTPYESIMVGLWCFFFGTGGCARSRSGVGLSRGMENQSKNRANPTTSVEFGSSSQS